MSTMSMFEYVALDRKGVKCKGVARAATEVDAYRQVAAAGLTPVTIKQAKIKLGKRRSVRAKEIAHFTYQLSVLISARVPIGEGLRAIGDQEPEGKFREVITAIATRIEAGGHIADAMAEHTAIFGEMYVQTIRAAEQSGNIWIKVLEYLSEILERQIETKQAVRSALMYPICVISVLGLAVFFLVGFVIPRFARMYEQKKLDLPIFTKIMVAFGDSVQNFWWLYLAVGVGAVFAVKTAWKRPGGRLAIEKFLHKIPFINQILVGMSVARFARIFGLSLSSGLSLIDALQMAGKSAGRPMLMMDVEKMVAQVKSGGRLSNVLLVCNYLPGFAKRMLISGEESAELTRMCNVIARHFERHTTSLTKNLSTVIEPILIVLIAAVVLVVALAIFLPMWNMVKLLS